MHNVEIVKNNGEREEFDPVKLKESLEFAGATVFIANDILKAIEGKLHDGMTTEEIYKTAFNLLKEKEARTAVRYSIRRSVLALGPSGFPFESYVAELFKAKGYTVRTDQMMQGKCVEHELDIVAYNDTELLLTEAKFHNQLGVKTDTKVALYVKARFDDLRNQEFEIDGKKRKMTRGILVTNTKFTENAVKYGRCVNTFDMISWSYPEKGNLYDLIAETGLHPITVVPQLSKHDKQELLNQGITNCKSLKDHSESMKKIGITPEKIDAIIENLEMICTPLE